MPIVVTSCYHVFTTNQENLKEDKLKNTFHKHFNSSQTPPILFINCVIPPTQGKDFAIIEIIYDVCPPRDFCEWRLPLFNKVQLVSRIIDGETYTMILGNHFKLKYID
jgi:hypothetical protein